MVFEQWVSLLFVCFEGGRPTPTKNRRFSAMRRVKSKTALKCVDEFNAIQRVST
jgi:hypothetical protein